MGAIASQITSLAIVYSAVYSDADQRKHESSASLAFVWGIHRDRWIPRTKGQLRGKCFHLMTSSWVNETQKPSQHTTVMSYFHICFVRVCTRALVLCNIKMRGLVKDRYLFKWLKKGRAQSTYKHGAPWIWYITKWVLNPRGCRCLTAGGE